MSAIERKIYALYRMARRGGEVVRLQQVRAARCRAEGRLAAEVIKAIRPADGPAVIAPRYNPKDRRAIAAIERSGGQVIVDGKRHDTPVVGITFSIMVPLYCEPEPPEDGRSAPPSLSVDTVPEIVPPHPLTRDRPLQPSPRTVPPLESDRAKWPFMILGGLLAAVGWRQGHASHGGPSQTGQPWVQD